jgi:DNA glycosylase AlkZ-like
MSALSLSDIPRQRLANQHLATPDFAAPQDVVAALGAVQSQDYAGGKWAIAQRMQRPVTDAELDDAFNNGTILRTHILRPTWHFVTPADIRWMLELTAPRVHAVSAFMYRQTELDVPLFNKTNRILEKALQDGKQKTRTELGALLEQKGISTKNGMRLAYIIMRAELDGVICSGARRGKQFTYALLDERAPNAKKPERDEALAELTRRYFSTRGPATTRDYVMWSGLTLTDARKGIELVKQNFESATLGDRTYWFPPPTTTQTKRADTVRLLPNYDEYFIGFQDRGAFSVGAKVLDATNSTAALSAHIVVLNAQIIGGWRRVIQKNSVVVELNLLTTLTQAQDRALSAAAKRFEQFLQLPVQIKSAKLQGTRSLKFGPAISKANLLR